MQYFTNGFLLHPCLPAAAPTRVNTRNTSVLYHNLYMSVTFTPAVSGTYHKTLF